MAKKFFNKKVKNRRRSIIQICIILGCIVGIVLCFIIANQFNKQKLDPNAVIKMKDMVQIGINTQLPDKTVLFAELQNVNENSIKVNYKNVDISKIGSYKAIVTINNKDYEVIMNVIDDVAPVLKLKDVSIKYGETYKLEDFIDSCEDNSKTKCNINYSSDSINEDGTPIDYAIYKKQGNYIIKIVATDESGNSTPPTATKLTIGNPPQEIIPVVCKYGNNLYDKEKYILTTYVTENNCAIDLNLYQSDSIKGNLYKIMDREIEKLKKELYEKNMADNITVNRQIDTILNLEGKGIVGFSLNIEVLRKVNGNDEVIAKYYVDSNENRRYSVNILNLK